MKLIFVGSLLNLLSISTYAQQVYFNSRFDIGINLPDGALSIYCDSNQIVSATAWTDLSTFKIDLSFFDLQGNFINKKTISSSQFSFYGGGSSSLDKTNDGGYILGGSFQTSSIDDALLYKFNSIGDTLWTKRIGDSANFQSGWQAKQTADSGFILCGQTMSFDADGDYLLVKTDSIGNIQWQKHFGSGLYDLATTVIQTNDGGYFFGGTFNNNYQMQGDGKFYKTDSVGNVQWTAQYGNPVEKDALITCIQTKDGGYLMGGGYTDSSQLNGSVPYGRLYLVKLNANGSLQWEKKYLNITYNVAIISIRELADSTIVAVGQTSDTILSFPAGFILKTNSNGDSLWYRTYELLTQNNNSHNVLQDIYPLPDGGLVACGYVFPMAPDTGTQDVWLLRVDSLGCTYSGCDPTFGIHEIFSQQNITLYPNPFTSNISIKADFTDASVEIYNTLGKKVFYQPLLNDKKINLSFLSTGLYIAKIIAEGKNYSVKILKE